MLSTHEVAAIQGRPLKYIIIYCVQILYYLTFVVGLRSWWLVALVGGHKCEREGLNYINNLHAFIYIKSGAHRPCLVVFGMTRPTRHHMT
jgi:hypothetical protein